jgi:hypothetical protein
MMYLYNCKNRQKPKQEQSPKRGIFNLGIRGVGKWLSVQGHKLKQKDAKLKM